MIPRDLIELGAVRGAYGIKGWVRIAPLAADGKVLESVLRWWLIRNSVADPLAVQQVRRHGESIVAKWQGCESREVAEMLKGASIAVARSDFPPPAEGEHYLSDVVGYRVVNREGVELGTVSGIRTAGAGMQWLEVKSGVSGREAILLVPVVDEYVDAIEVDTRMIKVDWQRDW